MVLVIPWASLAHSQHENLPLIQLASYTGEYGITFLIVMTNYVVALALQNRVWRFLILPGAIYCSVHLLGMWIIIPDGGNDRIRVTVVQPNIRQNERKKDEDYDRSVNRLFSLTLAQSSARPAIVVWPETAIKKTADDKDLFEHVRAISKEIGAPIITGSSEVEKFAERLEKQNSVQFNSKVFNSAYFIPPDGPLPAPYRKRRLVPFSEYIPEIGFQWPKWLVSDSFDINLGAKYVHFPIGKHFTVSPIICWENLFADNIIELVREGSDIIVQLTNDNRFGETAAPYQHNIASVFRAVENRIPVVIASNTGPSQIIDQSGKIVADVPYVFKQGAATTSVALRQKQTFYTKYGDLFCKLCIVVTLTGICLCFLTLLKIDNKSRISPEN